MLQPLHPSENDPIPGLPMWTWAGLELVMVALAANAASRIMARHLMAATRLQSPFLPPEQVRREFASIFSALVDPSFPEEASIMS